MIEPLAQAHYVHHLNHLHHSNYPAAIDSLHRYFDYSAAHIAAKPGGDASTSSGADGANTAATSGR
jgi:anaphase-promoting complex subunit 5